MHGLLERVWRVTGKHLDDEILAMYANGPAEAVGREAIEQHLVTCAECAAALVAIRAFELHAADPDVWAPRKAVPSSLEPPAELVRTAAQIALEDATADYLLAPALRDRAIFSQMRIAEDVRFHTEGVVRRLIRASAETREWDVSFALSLANAAVIISEQLGAPRYPRTAVDTLKGNAWRERGNALRYAGDYPAALGALDHAESAFRNNQVSDFDLATVDFTRGTVLWKMGRHAEALPLARRSAEVFLEFGDVERCIHAGLLEGSILFDSGDFAAGRDVFKALLPHAEKLDSGATLGRIYANLAVAHQELGDLAAAAPCFQEALALYEHFGMEIEQIRTRWSLALLALRQGHREDGIARLRTVMADFTNRGSMTDAGLVALDLVEQLTEAGQMDEVLRLSDDLGDRFMRAGMAESAAAAFQFLRNAAREGASRTNRAVVHVRGYFERLASQPTLLFIEPPPAE